MAYVDEDNSMNRIDPSMVTTLALREFWAEHYSNLDRLERIHHNMMVND